jgi:hypothetical protein
MWSFSTNAIEACGGSREGLDFASNWGEDCGAGCGTCLMVVNGSGLGEEILESVV